MKFSRKRRQFLIMLVDLILLITSVYISLFLRNATCPSLWYFLEHLKGFSLIILFWIIFMYTLNMYSLDKPFSIEKISLKIAICSIMATLIGFSLFYLFPTERKILPKTVLVVYGISCYILILLWRVLFNSFFNSVKTKNNYIFIGYTNTVKELLKETKKDTYVNFKPIAIYEENDITDDISEYNIPVITTISELSSFVEKNCIKIFVLPEEKTLKLSESSLLFTALENKGIFYTLPDFFETLTRKIPLGAINESWFLRNITFDGRGIFLFLKRSVDILLSGILLVITIVFWPFFALIIKLESKGPVFFTQVRDGINGSPFKLYKFRTMRTEDNSFAPTSVKDNRVTKFGNFMRKTRIDELPQLLNVLKGDMSLIGPRPERPELSKELEKEIPYYRQRLMVKPGITGWDQVSGEYHSPSIEDTYKKLQYDLYYIKNQSIFLDISIFFKTIMTVFMKAGR